MIGILVADVRTNEIYNPVNYTKNKAQQQPNTRVGERMFTYPCVTYKTIPVC